MIYCCISHKKNTRIYKRLREFLLREILLRHCDNASGRAVLMSLITFVFDVPGKSFHNSIAKSINKKLLVAKSFLNLNHKSPSIALYSFLCITCFLFEPNAVRLVVLGYSIVNIEGKDALSDL